VKIELLMETLCFKSLNLVSSSSTATLIQRNDTEKSVKMFLRGRPVVHNVPEKYAATYDIAKVQPAPSKRLKMDWVSVQQERGLFVILSLNRELFKISRFTATAAKTAAPIYTNCQPAKWCTLWPPLWCCITWTSSRNGITWATPMT
jgi:HELP motif